MGVGDTESWMMIFIHLSFEINNSCHSWPRVKVYIQFKWRKDVCLVFSVNIAHVRTFLFLIFLSPLPWNEGIKHLPQVSDHVPNIRGQGEGKKSRSPYSRSKCTRLDNLLNASMVGTIARLGTQGWIQLRHRFKQKRRVTICSLVISYTSKVRFVS